MEEAAEAQQQRAALGRHEFDKWDGGMRDTDLDYDESLDIPAHEVARLRRVSARECRSPRRRTLVPCAAYHKLPAGRTRQRPR